jgi:hypothetical protein
MAVPFFVIPGLIRNPELIEYPDYRMPDRVRHDGLRNVIDMTA